MSSDGLDKTDSSDKENIEHIIQGLERKANVTRETHVLCLYKNKKNLNLLTYSTVSLSLTVSLLGLLISVIFTLDQRCQIALGVIISFAGIAILFLSFSDRIFGITEMCTRHEQGIKILTDFIRECHQFRHIDLPKLKMEESVQKLNLLQEKYSHINHILPLNHLSTYEFLKIKQDFLIKVDISRKLDENPHLDLESQLKKT